MNMIGALMCSIVVIVADQLTKWLILTHAVPYDPIVFLPMLNWTLAFNSGSAFSFLSQTGDWHTWFFLGFSSAMSVFLIAWMARLKAKACLERFALSLILGGALGNLIDRLRLGAVVDFIDVFYKNHHWPVFNVADMAICIGGGLLLVDLWLKHRASH